MKILNFSLSLIVTISLCILLNISIDSIPPVGKFLNPFTGFWLNMMVDDSNAPNISEIEGLRSSATIHYDEHLIPHIKTDNYHDACLIQGYIEARHRLWQMDFQTRAAAGRLSEVFGEATLTYDRKIRRLGLPFGAKNLLSKMKDDEMILEMVSAYAKGVNTYIDNLSPRKYPVEFKLLGYNPEKWEEYNTALLLTYMSNILANNDYSIENTNFVNLYGKENFNYLYPSYEKDPDPVIPAGTLWPDKNINITSESERGDIVISELLFERDEEIAGSNNWAVNGEKTSSGHPILANDPHLRLSLPSVWFQLHITTPESNVYGVSFPGTPAIIIGFNDHVAWGVTNAGRDVRDWYEIEFIDDEKYRFSDDEYEFSIEEEVISVKNSEDFIDKVYYTHLGPVAYDESFKLKGKSVFIASKWTAHQPSQELMTFRLLNEATDLNDFKVALSYYGVPPQNFVFASREGDIAIKQQGLFPYYEDDRGEFIIKSTGDKGKWDFVPFDENPMVVNPARNFVSSANQHPTDSTYPYKYAGFFEQYRNRRINHLLSQMENISIQDMKRIQNDNYNIQAEESLTVMLDHISPFEKNEAEKEAFEILSSWDYFNDAELIAPSYYQCWWDSFYNLSWDEMDREDILLRKPHKYRTVDILINNAGFEFFDILSTVKKENATDVLWITFQRAVKAINKWEKENGLQAEWWRIKGTDIRHLTRQIDAFGKLNIMTGGNKGIINATSKFWGPSWKMIVHLDENMGSFGIYPGGQSGNPGSPYYDNFIEKWKQGEYYELHNSDPGSFSGEILYSFKVNPAK